MVTDSEPCATAADITRTWELMTTVPVREEGWKEVKGISVSILEEAAAEGPAESAEEAEAPEQVLIEEEEGGKLRPAALHR